MSNYTENFTSVAGDTTDASELEAEFDAIAVAIATKLDSDGSGTLTGDLSFGNNNATNVSDPTAAQHAATKNYVDTMFVTDYDSQAATVLTNAEQVISTLTVTIPSDWIGYEVEVLATYWIDRIFGSPGNEQHDIIFREAGLGGAIISRTTEVTGSDAADWSAQGALFGYQAAQTTTGSRTFVLTDNSGASGAFSMLDLYCKVSCRRVS